MPSKSDISVLPLEGWVAYTLDNEEDFSESDLKQIEPILHRDGWYFNRRTKLEWYEYKGKAFLPRSANGGAQFLYNLKLLNSQVLTAREVEAYKEMLRLRPPKHIRNAIRDVLYYDEQKKYLREIRNSYRRI